MEEEQDTYITKLIKGTGLFLIFGFYSYVIAFFFKLFVARHYGPSDLGLLILAQTILGLLVLIASLGVNNGITRYIPYYKERKETKALTGYIEFIFRIPIIFSIILSILLFIFSKNLTNFFQFPMEFSIFLKIISLVLPISILNQTIRKIFLAESKPIYTVTSYHLLECTILFFTALLFIYLDLPMVFIVAALCLSILIPAIYNLLIYKIKISLPLSKIKTFFIKDWFNFSWPLLFTGIFAFFISWSDNLIIGKFLEPTQLGIYSIAYSLAIFLIFFQKSFSHIFVPLISENYAKKNLDNITFLFRNAAAWTFGLTFPFFLVIILFSKQILSLLFGSEFAPGFIALIIISIGVLINISTGLCMEVLMLYKKTKFIFSVNLFIALTNIVLNLILIPILGILGAAITSAFSIALQNLFFLWKALRYQKLSFNWIYNVKFIIAGFPSVFIALFVFRSLIFNKLLAIIVTGVVYLIVYVVILLIIKTPTKEDIRILLMVEKKLGLNLIFIKRILSKIYKY